MTGDEFREAVLDVVGLVPPGWVTTYGDIAEYLGHGGPRQVAQVMAREGAAVPWWRVVRADGSLPVHLAERAIAEYAAEGTPTIRQESGRFRIDMRRGRWSGEV
ncbi:MGMT family protein [Saxibacter everestensis]|uniref:MGMT family protein n=1 Tax=Saxibacter everestensis TaxID=2909229 RepID=A0ABY8QQ49_9MICO|nr:MGMT family protein [Brevibacteriaceae bacterium ZFBP1038]